MSEEIKAMLILSYFVLSILSGIIWVKELNDNDKFITFVVATGFSMLSLPLYFFIKNKIHHKE